ncbi:MAG: hypothetical protein Q8M98_07920 [Candidatus Cloacimonadaceae bacterium]|nr:hypothetical protein [Candidatus Cloacimonadaceae bacterium]MDP3114691.1 hypothetical protein [Candidatus Cloacimonadaceae bacterium]
MRKIAILLSVLILLSACDLFRLRDSEPPTKPPPWNSLTTTWEKCLENIQFCYLDSRNVVKYSGLFTDAYRFYFSAQDINDFNINLNWNRANEQDMLINLHSRCDSIGLELETLPGQNDEIGANVAKVYRKYILKLYRADSADPQVFSGNFELHIAREFGNWYIARWYDYRSYATPTWGKVKYDFSQ